LYNINFFLYHNKASWSATINQLNSDVLTRHILPRINISFFDLSFSFCETEESGKIINSQGMVLGTFSISSNKGG
ncbi:hypothetical protein, partial [Vibrio pectenicida]|uniref:hypothetical protein n=1 Tax=Vibrio pectenicida TaxID=62763 RepID=UPI001FE2BCC6